MNEYNCHCLKCGNKWFSIKVAKTGIYPKECPVCHSYKWTTSRVRKRRKP